LAIRILASSDSNNAADLPHAAATLRSLSDALDETRGAINSAIDRYARFSDGCPPRLSEAIRYCLLAPGKRLRPTLVLWAAEACGSSVEAAMPAACAVEMIHTYSLVHDDLPAMDDDDLRRGRPTCHKVYGEANAILVGDALQALAFEAVARDIQSAEVAVQCVAALAEAAGAAALVGGQADDLARAKEGTNGTKSTLETLESIHRRKTGAMFVVSLRLGAIVAGADRERRGQLEEYGRKLGLAFQIADDLLDVQGSEAKTGKRVGKDSNRGKLTFPGLLGIEESRRQAEQLIDEACAALAPLGPAAERLTALARYVIERNR
jgi:geranylgeranyl diphosphate synthase, type II